MHDFGRIREVKDLAFATQWAMVANDPSVPTSELLRLHGGPRVGDGIPFFLAEVLTRRRVPPSARPWPTSFAPWVWSQPCDFDPDDKEVLCESYSRADIRELSKLYADMEWHMCAHPGHQPSNPAYMHFWDCFRMRNVWAIFDERRPKAEIAVDLALTPQQLGECVWFRRLQ